MSLALLFHYLMLNMFRMLIYPSSGACDLFIELFHGLYCSGLMCVGVTLWFGWGGVVSVCRLRCNSLPVGQGLLIHEVSRSHTTTHHSRYDSSGRVISSSQRPLPDNTQNSQQRSIPPGGIRTHNLSRRAAANLRLRPRGYWDRRHICM